MPLTVQDYLTAVTSLGLCSEEQIDSFHRDTSALPAAQTSEELARRLVARRLLTAFQARQIYAGKAARLVLGNYLILDKLGQGGMGTVFKAMHRRMERTVALKVLSAAALQVPGAITRFQREVKAAAQLSHSNIVTAFDADEIHGTHFFVMEFVDGQDLASVVKNNGPLRFGQSCDYLIQAAQGLAYAHEHGVIHRDIKPANLLLDQRGAVKVLDMGLARLQAVAGAHTSLTGSGQLMGTLDYMAPEQAVDTKHADHRADIYSLGMTWWYLLAGRPAYDGDSIIEKVLAHRERPIPLLLDEIPEAPATAGFTFERLVAKRPEDRYASMIEVIDALATCQREWASTVTTDCKAAAVGASKSSSLGPTAIRSGAAQLPGVVVPETISLAASEVDTSPSMPAFSLQRNRGPRRQRRVLGMPQSIAMVVLGIIAVGVLSAGALSLLPRGRAAKKAKDSQAGAAVIPVPPGGKAEAVTASDKFALRFDGTDDYVEFPMMPLLATDPVTLEAWITPTGDYSARPANPWIDGHILGWENFEDLCLAAFAEGLGTSISVTIEPGEKGPPMHALRRPGLGIGKRQHMALTLDRTFATLFIDGKKVDSQTLLRGIPNRRSAPKMGAFIDHGGKLERAFEGLIDEARISKCIRYRDDFVPDEVFAVDADAVAVYHFDDATGGVLTDSTSNRYHGAIKGAQWEPLRK